MTTTSNSKDSSSLTDQPDFYITTVFILFFLSLIIALENLLVLISIGMFIFKKYSINPFICSLSLADILHFLGPVLISLYIYISDRPQGFQQHYSLCKIQSWLTVFLQMTSMLSIVMLAIDRNLLLTKPVFYERKWKGLLLVVVVITCWMLSAFLSSWQMLSSEDVKPTRFAPHIYCLFTPSSSFAISFASIHLFFVLVCVVSVIYTSSSRNSLFRAEYSSATGKIKVKKTRNLVQEEYTRKMTRMVSIVVCLYCASHLPWMVAIFLGYFNVTYPPIYGLLSLQFPMVSSLCNPLLYGLVWPPFKNAYVNTVKAPMRMCKRDTRNIRSHSFQDSSLSRSYSFWSAEGFPVTADQEENSPQVLFGPSSHSSQPINFMPEELRIFENEGLTADSISLEIVGKDGTHDATSDVTCSNNISTAATNIALDASGQFQSILDLIEEMTEGKSRAKCSSKKGKNQSIDSKETSRYWSADESSTHAPSQNGRTSSTTDGAVVVVDTHPWEQDRQGTVRSGIAGCVCIGKSERYVIDNNRNRYLNYAVTREVTEICDPSNEVGVIMNGK
ncbi:adenosine receptor A3-like [Actinia tenebrosa]|uniref:Adenosine receptor A3-like n=1 Tax=Actinia tenebrosa TaxID=6105 RepID=A0A6P8IR07_ACTTE|nr:adenosine receptor A3-like [Actinia tenebrosa]